MSGDPRAWLTRPDPRPYPYGAPRRVVCSEVTAAAIEYAIAHPDAARWTPDLDDEDDET